MTEQSKRVATVIFFFPIAGLFTKTSDTTTNSTMEAFIVAFGRYMGSIINSRNVSFFYVRAKRINLTFKQHMQI